MPSNADLLEDLIFRRQGTPAHPESSTSPLGVPWHPASASDQATPTPGQSAFVSDADMADQIQLGILNSTAQEKRIGATGGAQSSTSTETDAFASAVEKLAQAADKLAKSNAICIIS